MKSLIQYKREHGGETKALYWLKSELHKPFGT